MDYNKKVLKQLQENYLVAVALEKLILELTDEIQTKVLSENEFFVTDEFKDNDTPDRITKPDETYLMNDADMTRFLMLLQPRYEEAGILSKRGIEYIPASDAKDMKRDAEQALIDYALAIIPKHLARQLKSGIYKRKIRDGVLNAILRLEC